ncbi:ataxin-7-like protein 3 isoform X1 [Sycon ciliatum]|uniref:ataxin-7-like protein 3 isoform X1 n=1 Tax=Sycon ciliatum TaxID=27933 RepID=UPI0031F5F6C0
MSEEASGDSSCAASASASAVIGQADQKTGIPRCIPPKVNPNERYTGEIIDKPGYDIFGQPISEVKKPVDVSCPECGRVVASNRFMQHLEKCMMNMGRQSSRVAEQRIKTGEQDDVYAPDDEEVDEADVEAALAGIEGQNKGARKRLRHCGSPRPQKIRRLALGPEQGQDASAPSSNASSPRSTATTSSSGSSSSTSGCSDWQASGESMAVGMTGSLEEQASPDSDSELLADAVPSGADVADEEYGDEDSTATAADQPLASAGTADAAAGDASGEFYKDPELNKDERESSPYIQSSAVSSSGSASSTAVADGVQSRKGKRRGRSAA